MQRKRFTSSQTDFVEIYGRTVALGGANIDGRRDAGGFAQRKASHRAKTGSGA